jgi:release factor glutamine methyltransferase
VTDLAARPLRTVLVDAERRLAAAGVPDPRVDSELMLAKVLDVSRTRLVLSNDVDSSELGRFEIMVARRASRVPLQHILGEAPFRYRMLQVGRGVFIPRPETEIVTEAGIRALRAASTPAPIAVDLCSGSGSVALALATEVAEATVYAVELAADAVTWLIRNVEQAQAELVAVRSVVHVVHADAGTVHEQELSELVGLVDVVVCNPPYIPAGALPRDPEVREFDPPVALYGGDDGLDVVRAIAISAAALLRPGGTLVVEHGDAQGTSAAEAGVPFVLRDNGSYDQVNDRVDLVGRDRFTMAVRR